MKASGKATNVVVRIPMVVVAVAGTITVVVIVRSRRAVRAQAIVTTTSFLELRRRGRRDWVPWRGHWFVIGHPAER